MENQTIDPVKEYATKNNKPFNMGTFNVLNPGATYELPVFEVTDKINLVGATNIQFVRGKKDKFLTILLGIFPQEDGSIKWGYTETIAGKEDSIKLYDSTEGLIKISAELQPDRSYILNLVGSQQSEIKIKPDGVIRESGVLYTQEELESEDFELDNICYIYAAEVAYPIDPQPGIIIESVLDMLIYDLEIKNEEIQSHDTIVAINKLKEAMLWLNNNRATKVRREVVYTNSEL